MKKTILLFFALISISTYQNLFAQNASVQVVHNAAGEGLDTVDVWINNILALDNIRYRTATAFSSVPVGATTEVRIKNANSTDTTNPLYFTRASLMSNRRYIISAQGDLTGRTDSAGKFSVSIYENALTTATTPGRTRILPANGASDLGICDLVNLKTRRHLADNLRYGKFSNSYLDLADSLIEIHIASANCTNLLFSATLNLSLLRDSAYTLYTSGYIQPDFFVFNRNLVLMLVSPSGRITTVRLLPNFASYYQLANTSNRIGSSQVAFWIDGFKIGSTLAQNKATDFYQGYGGRSFISVTDSAALDTVGALATTQFNFFETRSYVINFTGREIADTTYPRAILIHETKQLPASAGTAEFKVISGHKDKFDVDFRRSATDTTQTTHISFGNQTKSLVALSSPQPMVVLSETNGINWISNFRAVGNILDSAYTFYLLPNASSNPSKVMITTRGRVVPIADNQLQARTLLINNTTRSAPVDFFTQVSTRFAPSGSDIPERNFSFLQANNISPIRVADAIENDSTFSFRETRITTNPAQTAFAVISGTQNPNLTAPSNDPSIQFDIRSNLPDRFPSADSALVFYSNSTLDSPQLRIQWDTLTTAPTETVPYRGISTGKVLLARTTTFKLFTTGARPIEVGKYTLQMRNVPAGRRVFYIFSSGSIQPTYGVQAMAIVPNWSVIPLSSDTTSILENETNKNLNFALYPNPSNTGSFTIDLCKNFGQGTLQIFTIQGQEVFNQAITAESSIQTFSPSKTMTEGMYLVRVKSNNGTSGTKLFLVR